MVREAIADGNQTNFQRKRVKLVDIKRKTLNFVFLTHLSLLSLRH